jgi:phosphatidate phosphatase APP1
MPSWRERVRGWWPGRDPLVVHAYPGFGTRDRVFVRGRVLDDEGLRPAPPGASAWRNLHDAWRRFETDERAGVRVRAVLHGRAQETETDDEGYFELALAPDAPPDAGQSWHEVTLEALDAAGRRLAHATARVLVPGAGARVAVISDIDDTVIQTGVRQVWKAARSVLLGSAHTRPPFPGVAQFYRALEAGGDGRAANPFFYVSSSPWNLYDVLLELMELHRIPPGPLFLRDWGLRKEALPFGHRAHKLAAIRAVADLYPHLPLLLVGDSGQEDPEIYHEVVGLFPGRVRAIYIRNVSPDEGRVAAIGALAERVLAAGSTLVLAEDTVAAARHAAAHGWITADRLPGIVAGKEKDEPPAKAAAVEETVVIAPSGQAAAQAVVESGTVEAALEPPASGEKTPAVVVESPAAPAPAGGSDRGGPGGALL